MTIRQSESGFTLIELIVATGVLLIVSSIVTNALLQMTNAQLTVWNRTEMHSGIRGATELLQQEVGQAGRIGLPGKVTLAAAVTAAPSCDPEIPTNNAVWVGVNTDAGAGTAVDGMFATAGPPAAYISLMTLDGDSQETIRVAEIDDSTSPARIRACFTKDHLADTTVLAAMGGFAHGIIPPAPGFETPPSPGYPNGSTDTVLKMYGDINGDGNMVYVEYTCDYASNNLYRNVMAIDAATKPPVDDRNILLSNIIPNPGGTDCFSFQTSTIVVQGTSFTFVLDVAITLTVQTEQLDPVTQQYQTETKALLNVSPRNVFNAWSLASIGYTDRIQSTPVSVTALLP